MNTCESSMNLSKIKDAPSYRHPRQETGDEWYDI